MKKLYEMSKSISFTKDPNVNIVYKGEIFPVDMSRLSTTCDYFNKLIGTGDISYSKNNPYIHEEEYNPYFVLNLLYFKKIRPGEVPKKFLVDTIILLRKWCVNIKLTKKFWRIFTSYPKIKRKYSPSKLDWKGIQPLFLGKINFFSKEQKLVLEYVFDGLLKLLTHEDSFQVVFSSWYEKKYFSSLLKYVKLNYADRFINYYTELVVDRKINEENFTREETCPTCYAYKNSDKVVHADSGEEVIDETGLISFHEHSIERCAQKFVFWSLIDKVMNHEEIIFENITRIKVEHCVFGRGEIYKHEEYIVAKKYPYLDDDNRAFGITLKELVDFLTTKLFWLNEENSELHIFSNRKTHPKIWLSYTEKR